jgi:hypothetical protein
MFSNSCNGFNRVNKKPTPRPSVGGDDAFLGKMNWITNFKIKQATQIKVSSLEEI